MEVMEEGNLMDRVPILLQRDLQYYQQHQNVLQEKVCPGVVGGKLDFPRYASFASIKIILWWEDEYLAAYRKNSGLLHKIMDDDDFSDSKQELVSSDIVKASDPEKFVSLVTKSADQLLNHLHTLSQESLDHADLTVLTATIGAAALVKNCLWVYLQCVTTSICPPKLEDETGGSLKLSYKQYSEMTEALAERLLDLHCRLLCLYIMQDADCLNWESTQPFFESERGSYTIQMWWLYIKGTKQDLWNSVPPKMAQRVFGGMLNETLTVLTVRYTQIVTSSARAQLLLTDICNLLFCVCDLLPAISENSESFIGLDMTSQPKIIRDIHAKCQELFSCLLLRGAPLGVLFKLFRKGTRSLDLFSSRQGLPSAWILFTLPKLFPNRNQWMSRLSELPATSAISLELQVLLGSPQANWSHLLKVLLMRDAAVSRIILKHLLKHLPRSEDYRPALDRSFLNDDPNFKCELFLCSGECFSDDLTEVDPISQINYQVVLALSYGIISTGKSSDISALIAAVEYSQVNSWSDSLDKRQVWDQKRPPWLEAAMHLIYPVLDCVAQMLVSSVQTGATMYQAMSLAITCLSEMWDCIPDGIYKFTMVLTDAIPVSTKCLADSVLIQVLFSALYSKLLCLAKEEESKPDGATKEEIYHTLCEAICSIDEDNKHTEQIKLFLKQAKESKDITNSIFGTPSNLDDVAPLSAVSTVKMDDLENGLQGSQSSLSTRDFDVENADYISEILVSDIITTNIGKKCLRLCYKYLKNNKEWLFQQLGVSDLEQSEFQNIQGQNLMEEEISLLKTMFFIGHKPFDQLLTGSLKIDYSWLQIPMGLTPERVWLQISKRFEFQENTLLSLHDTAMIAAISNNFKM